MKATIGTPKASEKKENKFAKKISPTTEIKQKERLTHADIQKEIENQIEHGNIQMISLDKIQELIVNGAVMHNRTTFDEKSIEKLAKDIKGNKPNGVNGTGLLHPIVLRPKDDHFERITGFRRELAFNYNQETEIPAIVVDVDDKTARAIRHSENHQREKLNDYDELISILEDLSYVTEKTVEELVTFFRLGNSHFDKSKSFSFNEEELRLLDLVSERLEQISPYSVKAMPKRIKLLNMEDEILDKMKANEIQFSNALIINALKDDKKFMLEVLSFNSKLNPTAEELKDYIKKTKTKTSSKEETDILKSVKKDIAAIKISKIKTLEGSAKEKADNALKIIQENLRILSELNEN